MATRIFSTWCEDCDRWAFDCRCEIRAEEARKEREYRREERLILINENVARMKYRAAHVKLIRVVAS